MNSKKRILLTLFVIIGIAGNFAYKYGFSTNKINSAFTSSEQQGVTKCVASNGETYYGEVPSGVACIESSTINVINTKSSDSKLSKEKNFNCDGRQYCSQMTSCAEAMYFNSNCPNTKMSGDGDGIPCERQWCGH